MAKKQQRKKKNVGAANDTTKDTTTLYPAKPVKSETGKYVFKFRFFGRFVFAQQADTMDQLDVWAIDMTHNPDVPSLQHRPVLTAPRGLTMRAGSLVPDLKVMALTCHPDYQSAKRLEHCVWNIEGYDITVMARGGFAWTNNKKLLDFETLKGGNTPVDPEVIPISSSIRFNAGRGLATSLFGHAVTLVRVCDPPLTEAQKEKLKKAGQAIRPADLVEVTVTSDEKLLILRFEPRDGDGPTSSIAFSADDDDPTVVNFTNVCNGSDDAPVDEEFAGMYEVLVERPITRERLVPCHLDGLGGPDDCFVSVYLKFK
jgi:hypothetical protein